MTCSSCAHENRPGAKFCGGCGGPLRRACAKCGSELPADVRFCDECGAPVAGATAAARPAGVAGAAGARKIVTLLFADLAGSTALQERLDPESARRFMESYYALARNAVESHGGTLAKLLGDGAMAVFGIPRVAEDDAIRAVRAAVAMQEAFRALASQQRSVVGETGLRVAVNTGEVVVKDETEIIGDPVNVAARLQERGRDGDVVLGEATRRLVTSQVTLEFLGAFDLKGRSEAVKAYRVVSLAAPGRGAATPFVGREDELGRIAAVYDRAAGTPAAHLAVLLGSPGLGKSRLIDEFVRRHRETATVVAAHCDAAGGATFAPLADALRELLDLPAGVTLDAIREAAEAVLPGDEAERSRIAAGIASVLAGAPGTPEETFFVVRRFLAGIARSRPVVLVIDDLQWAEPLLLDLVEHLVQWGRALPLLVLAGARPELREVRSSFTTPGALVADVVSLGALDAGVAMRLAAGVIGAADLPAAVAVKVLATSEGNPLFIGELVRMLVDEGALVRDGDRWTAGETLATVEMPPTIHALLSARIERLDPQSCAVLERAAVVGRQFSRSAVAALLPGDVAVLDARLESLQRAQLLERDTGWMLGEPVLRFHHALIRDAAYRRLLKGTRAELHERLADWVEERGGEAREHDETIGRHLEEAHRLLGELGPIDDAGRLLGERAATRLASAGRRALEGDDVALAAGLLGRALERLDENDRGGDGAPAEEAERRAELCLDWCEALLAAGDVAGAARAIERLGRLVHDSDRLRAWHTCFLGHHTVLTAPRELSATVGLVAEAATTLASLDDAAGEAKGHFVHALGLSRLGRVGACEASLDKALAAARRAGDRRRANTVLAIAPLAALWGPSPVTRASGRCLDVVRVLRITQGAPAVEAVALSCQGVLEALRGRTDAARRMIASARRMVEELGIAQRLYDTDVFAGFVAMLEGDAAAAERSLREARDGFRELGLGVDTARACASLARVMLAQDRIEEAEALSHESEALAGDDLKAAIAWRGVRAEALARRGEHVAAVELAQAAVEIAAATDALLDHADARLALAAALRSAGRSAEADAEDGRAIELWEEKGATLLAERARRGPDFEPSPAGPARGAEATSEPASRPAETESVPGAGPKPRRRPVPANAATRLCEAFQRAAAARDAAGLQELVAQDLRFEHRPTGTCYGAREFLGTWRAAYRAKRLEFDIEVLASLGDSLALQRHRVVVEGLSDSAMADFGRSEFDEVVVFETDDAGRCCRMDLFAPRNLGDAIVRLYEAHAERLPEGPVRALAAGIARNTSIYCGPIDPDQVALSLDPASRNIDHRVFGTWTTASAAETLRNFRHQLELAPDFAARIDDILALGPDALLVEATFSGTARDSGGAFENRVLELWSFHADGRLLVGETFEAEQREAALARFDALAGGAAPARPPAADPFANRATRLLEEMADATARQDWTALSRLFAPAFDFDDRRPLLRLRLSRDGFLEQHRLLFDAPNSRWANSVVATRGERLVLARMLFHGDVEPGGGALEIDHLVVLEADRLDDGRDGFVGAVLFAPDDRDAACAELERRFEVGEAAAFPLVARALGRNRILLATDREGWAAWHAPGFVYRDHRQLGFGDVVGNSDALARLLRSTAELVPDARYRDDHVRISRRGILKRTALVGTRDGGAFENPLFLVEELDEQGRFVRADSWDIEDRDQVLACFAGISGAASFGSAVAPISQAQAEPTDEGQAAGSAAPPYAANAAVRAVEQGTAALAARDWGAFSALMAPGFRHYDRTRIAHLESDGADWLAAFRRMVEMTSAPPAYRLVATRGERLALFRMLWRGAGGDVGPSEIEWHLIVEVNERGEHTAIVVYDPDDFAAAHAELEARFEARERDQPRAPSRPEPVDPRMAALNLVMRSMREWFEAYDPASRTGDWDALRRRCHPDFVFEDRRRMALLRGGLDLMIASVRERATSGARPDWSVVGLFGDRVALQRVMWAGGASDGRFEIEYFAVIECDENGLLTALVLLDLADAGLALQEARRRWSAIEPERGS